MKKYLIIISILIIFIPVFSLLNNFGSKEGTVFQIRKGQSLKEISLNLEKEGIISWSPVFKGYVLLRGVAGKLQSGCYLLSRSMTIPEITKILSSGAIAKEKITIPEGFTSEQIHQLVKNFTISDRQRWQEHEGYLFPDTYEIPYCQEQDKIIEMMLDNFNKKTANLKITPEIVVMASLLERELKTKEDKELASGILWKRLKTGIPLQVDVEPWTYENYGLPPGPIANPGLDSIEASVYPKNSLYWYYLSTREGQTIFSRTLEEHNIAKTKYLKP